MLDLRIPFWMMCGAALGAITCGIIGVAETGCGTCRDAVLSATNGLTVAKLGAAYEDFNVHDGWVLPDSYTTRKLVDSIASDVTELEKRKFKFPDEVENLALLQNATRRLVKLHDRLIEEYKQSKGLKGAYPPCDNYGHVSPIDKRLVSAQEHLKGAKDNKCGKDDCPYHLVSPTPEQIEQMLLFYEHLETKGKHCCTTKCPWHEKGKSDAPPKITPSQFR